MYIMNNLEKELDTFQGTSITSINKDSAYDRELFKDVNSGECKDCNNKKDITSFVKEIEKRVLQQHIDIADAIVQIDNEYNPNTLD